ncbi:phospholipase A and acyltransferase 3-like [Odontesthes bonariensis]|uniref:phospholipase A and acyltransferase 3-like isoform X2 n=1 Tax=Odontesthes bonariensis TaxID=219752 RepID=UPI003F583B0A
MFHVTKQPELGDLIEIFRGIYQHWAVYVGGDFVVHFVQEGGSGFSSFSNSGFSIGSGDAKGAFVRKVKLRDAVEDNKWVVNNSLDHKYTPYSPGEIVRRAHAKVGEELRYDLLTYNCEHFANEMRYGVKVSSQVLTVATGGLAGPLSWLG